MCDELGRAELNSLSGDFLCALSICVGDYNVCSFARQQQSRLTSNATSATDDQGDLAAELGLRGHALQLGFLQCPVLDPKCFRTRQRNVTVKLRELFRLLGSARLGKWITDFAILQRICSSHHVNGIDKEFRSDAGL